MSEAQQEAPATDDIPSSVDHRIHGTPRIEQHTYSEQQRALALAVYAETGSCETASQNTGIPRTTIKSWVDRDPDIEATLDALRLVVRERAGYLVGEIAVLAAEETKDRLLNGDYHYDKEGKVTRRKVNARDAALIAATMIDKHAFLTVTVAKRDKIDAELRAISEGLRDLSRKARGYPQAGAQNAGDSPSIIDATICNSLNDKGE